MSIDAGWYPDPTGRPGVRWWDGTAWTQAPSIQVSNGDSLSGVSSISSTEAWAVGFSGPTPTKTLAFHFK